MTNHAAAIHRVRVLAAGLRAGRIDSIAADDRERLAEAVERILAGEDAGIALGLRERRLSVAERDRVLRSAATRFFPGTSMAEQGRRLHAELLRYHTTAWQRERTSEQCPHHRGTLQESLWLALRAADRVPSSRSIRRMIVGHESMLSTANFHIHASTRDNG